MGMPDDHESTIVTWTSDDQWEYMQVTDISDINFGVDFDEDIKTVLNPPRRKDSEDVRKRRLVT